MRRYGRCVTKFQWTSCWKVGGNCYPVDGLLWSMKLDVVTLLSMGQEAIPRLNTTQSGSLGQLELSYYALSLSLGVRW